MDIVNWRKARASAADNGCVEVGTRPDGMVMIRDTKNRERGHLAVDVANWLKFVAEVKASLRSRPEGSRRYRRDPRIFGLSRGLQARSGCPAPRRRTR